MTPRVDGGSNPPASHQRGIDERGLVVSGAIAMLLLTVVVLPGAAALWTHPWRIERRRARIRAEPFHPDTFVVQREQALGAEAPEVYAELAGLYGLQPLAW